MFTFTRFFDRFVFLFAIASALLIGFSAIEHLTHALAKVITPAYVPKQMITVESAYNELKSGCIERDIKYDVSLPCSLTQQDITKVQESDLSSHRYQYDSWTVGSNQRNIQEIARILGVLMLLISLLRLLYKFYIHSVRPAMRRATAPARTRHMEQEFLQMKLLHENGVISDVEFGKKKEQLRAKVMAE